MKRLLYSKKAAPYLFVLPFIITLLVFWAVPVGRSFVMSFHEVLYGQESFVGVANYERMVGDRVFWQAMWNSFRYMVLTMVLLVPIPMVLAAILNSKIGSDRVKSFFKASLFVPALTSLVVAGLVFRLMFSESETAVINQVFGAIGLDPVRWLREDVPGLVVLLVLAVWRWTGVNTMYFLAGMQAIPREYYEAASIDGAGRVAQFFQITVPNLRPTIVYVVTISIYGGLAMFTESFMLYAGNQSPNNQGLTIVGYLYRQGIQQNDMGFASAVGVVLLAVVLTINITQLTLTGTFRKEEAR
ncbi:MULTISPECIES: carbohydrate ABC transporter permease [unclassified Microbacterium]|uniref:carbohydrate ABC transporter permease n=1 Tax=unclassified Microbacterium TaxID=2609290 RepID=UPI00097E9256|nr:sugar ABC transporter permease [Microbacterium sp. JB110]RCS60830.1 sugar ABC transporter permease [Microbacterium sp. JB110]SJM64500.1 Alpha-arabinosides ABC transport system, permease protein 1 [Frigoribacterium sp. JB110]